MRTYSICDRICEKVPFSHTKFDPIFLTLKLHNLLIISYKLLKFSLSVATVVGYILILRAS